MCFSLFEHPFTYHSSVLFLRRTGGLGGTRILEQEHKGKKKLIISFCHLKYTKSIEKQALEFQHWRGRKDFPNSFKLSLT